MYSFQRLPLVPLALFALLLVSSGASAQGMRESGPSGGTWTAFPPAGLSDAQAHCAQDPVVWVTGSATSGAYVFSSNPLAGKNVGAWGCFAEVVVAGFQPASCPTPDEMVWIDAAKKVWYIPQSSGYKTGSGGYVCLTVALNLGFTQGLAAGPMRLIGNPSVVKCTSPDQEVWVSENSKTSVAIADLSAAKGKGGYACLSLASLNGYKLIPTGYAHAADANCLAPGVAVWLDGPHQTFWPANTPGYNAEGGQGVFMCKSDALANLKYVDASKIAGTKGAPLDSYPDASQPKCGSGEKVAWARLDNHGVVGPVRPSTSPNVGTGGYICWSNAIGQADGLAWECVDGLVFNDGKYAWPPSSQTYQYYQKLGNLPSRFICASTAADFGIGPPPPGTPDSPAGPTLGSLTCFPGDKIEWILATLQRVALGSSGAGQGDGAYLCATASGDHPYAGTNGILRMSGPKGSLLGFGAIPGNSVVSKICNPITKYGDMYSYGAHGQYGFATMGSPYILYIYGDARFARVAGSYACADDAVAAGWTPKKVNAP